MYGWPTCIDLMYAPPGRYSVAMGLHKEDVMMNPDPEEEERGKFRDHFFMYLSIIHEITKAIAMAPARPPSYDYLYYW